MPIGNPEQNSVLANRLKELCKEKEISYAELAERSRLPVRRIQRMAYGRVTDPGIFQMMRICKTLGVTLDEFVANEDFNRMIEE